MARQLTFEIVAQTYEAEAKLRIFEAEIAQLNKALAQGSITWDEYQKSLKAASVAAASAKETVTDLKQGTQEQTSALGALQAAILRYAGPAAMGYAIKQTLNFASQLEDLSARSGISVKQLQQLNLAAQKSGGSLEQVSNAAAMMLDRLGSNDKALIKAVDALGLNLADLKKQDPGQMFIDLATAIARVEDPAKRMALAVDVFGRQGRTLMPMILEIGKGLEQTTTLTVEQTRKLDALSEVLLNVWQTLKVIVASIVTPFAPALTALGTAAGWAAEQFSVFLSTLMKWGGAGPLGVMDRWLDFADTLKGTIRGTPLTGPKVGAAPGLAVGAPFQAGTLDVGSAEYKAIVKDLTEAHKDAAAAARTLARAHVETAVLVSANAQRLSYLNYGTAVYGATPDADLVAAMNRTDLPILRDLGLLGGPTKAPGVTPSGLGTGAGLLGGFGGTKGFSTGLSSVLMSAFTGGGNVGQSIGGFLGGGLFTSLASKGIGTALGGAMGSILPGLGTVIGAGLGSLLGKLFGSGEAKKTKQARGQFIEQFGGLDALKTQAGLAGYSLDTLLSTKKTKTLEAEIKRLNKALEDMKKRVEAITTALTDLSAKGGLLSRGLLDQIQRDLKNPEVQQAVFAFMQQQSQAATDALTNYITNAKIQTEGGAQALAGSIMAVFAELQRQGATAVEALTALQPAILGLGQQLDRMGLGGGEAFDTLRRMATLAADDVAGPLLTAVGDLSTLMTSLANLGLMNQEIFSGLTGEITATYDQLLALGHDGQDVLQLMQQPLQRIYELQSQFGYTVDESTQALLDQAKAAGLIGDQFKSSQDRMVDAVNKLIDRLDVLIGQIGVGLPDAINRVPAIHVPVYYDRQSDPYADVPQYARGSGGVRDFGAGTLAVLHGQEGVFTQAQVEAMTSGVTVNVDARGALLPDVASQAALAEIIADAVMRQQRLRVMN